MNATPEPKSDPASGEAVEFIREDELRAVLSQYEIGEVHRTVPLDRGSGKSPKVILQTDLGEFLLKKRTGRHAQESRTSAVHHLHIHLAGHAFPVPGLIGTRPNGRSMTRYGDALFELSQFVRGLPYDRSPATTRSAGRMLARFHHVASTCASHSNDANSAATFHDVASQVAALARQAINAIQNEEQKAGPVAATSPLSQPLNSLLNTLVLRYREASYRVLDLGFGRWPSTTVHGDWHPGNLVFRKNAEIAAVLDLDGMRMEPRATDIANGALQFSMRIDSNEPADWPASVDEIRLLAFCDGYDEFDDHYMLSGPEVRALPYLMIEALIAESLGPIAATGRFGRITGRAFLEVIERKSAWLAQHAERITRVLGD